jgi:ketosteroid isomerase-like protein
MEDSAEDRMRALLGRYCDAWRGGDWQSMLDCYHDEFTLNYFGSNALSGRHAGKIRAVAILREFTRRTRRVLVSVQAIMAGPVLGALSVREKLAGGASSREVTRIMVYSAQEGRLKECWVYDEDQAFIDHIVGSI